MQNIKLTLAYDGTNYCGWQENGTEASIENTLQRVIEQVLQHEVVLQAASRTDAGVHANRQVVNFFTYHLDLEPHRTLISLNYLLPKDIVVIEVEKVDQGFHPTLDCKGKEYRYYICYGPFQLPQHRFYSWKYHYPLDLNAMREAAGHLIGTHDFSAFCKNKKTHTYTHYMRTIESIELNEIEKNRLCIVIKGNNFLYRMVRNIVGTLAYVGNGKLNVGQVDSILHSQDRASAGVTAPPHGLFLEHVFY